MVLMKKVVNANPGTADTVGGNDWDKLADYFNDIDTLEVPRINTPTEFRSGILKIRGGSNLFNIAMKGATQTADRDFTIPALIGNDSPAMLALANIFTNLQTVTLDADTLLSLYRPVNTTNTLCGFGFNQRNSSNASVVYANISNRLITNTAGDEDGKLVFYVRKDGILTEVMSIDKDGTVTAASFSGGVGGGAGLTANTFTGIQTISVANALPLVLYRPANTANNLAGIDFTQNNSSSAAKTFARYQSKIITNTAAAEDGAIEEYVSRAGTVTKVRSLDKDGKETLGFGQNLFPVCVVKNSGVVTTTASTSTEFDILNYSVPANLLGLNGLLRCRVSGYLVQNASASEDFTLKVKFGGTTSYQGATTGVSQTATQRPFIFEVDLGNKNATNVQGCAGKFALQDTNATTTGNGDINDDEMVSNANFRGADTAQDTTAAKTLQITMTHSASSANMSTSVQRNIIEYLPGA